MLLLRWNSFLLLLLLVLLFSSFKRTRYRFQSNLYIVKHHIKLSLFFLVFRRVLRVA